MIRIADDEIDRWLGEDMPYGDLTTRSLGLSGQHSTIAFMARADLVACATEEAARLMARLGCSVGAVVPSGARARAGQPLLRADGSAEAVLAGWKVAQTLMEYASGIATAAARIVTAARAVDPRAVVACTRKNFPGTKAVSIKAIIAGGAVPHRLGLSDTVLLFPEHRALMDDISLVEAIDRLKATCPEKKIVVEVARLDDVASAAAAGADVVQLEKFTPEQTAEALARIIGSNAQIAAAGGINVANAAAYVQAGARILVTSAPYAAAPVDIKVAIAPAVAEGAAGSL